MSSFDEAVKRHQQEVAQTTAREQAEEDEALREATIVAAKIASRLIEDDRSKY